MAEYAALKAEEQERIVRPFDAFVDSIEQQTLIAVIRENLRRFEEKDYPRQLSMMTEWAQPPSEPATDVDKPPSDRVTDKPAVKEPQVQYVASRTVQVSFDKAWLADENDVDRYVAAMREALMAEIRGGKRIQI
jgi:hypothetical protein